MLTFSLFLFWTYEPDHNKPKELKKRNMLFIIPLITGIFWIALNLFNLFKAPNNFEDAPLAFSLNLVFDFSLIAAFIFINSYRKYDQILTKSAEEERNWTNNVLSLLSHNIRTPIATMGNRVEIIKFKHERDKEISQDDIESLDNARESVNAIVHGLLSTSSRNLISEVRHSDRYLAETLSKYSQRVTVDIPSQIDIEISAHQSIALELFLDSLISNSQKYGSTAIVLSLRECDTHFELSLSDDGVGMDEATLKRYGTPFNSGKSVQGGTGMGVYFSMKLVENAGWSWKADSALGQGTTVTITLPKNTVKF
jgi:signal transduction histidine kinase